jgi:mono/diheme cytochrome c family protein
LDKSFLIGGKMNKLLCVFLCISFSSCKVITGTDESSRFKVYNFANSQVDFTVLRDNVLVPQCLQCHSWSSNEAAVNKRIIPGNPDSSDLYKIVKSGQMPSGKPRLTDQSLKLVEQYILHLQGTKAEAPIALAPTYASLKVNLFEKSCIKCHDTDVLAKHPKRPLLSSKEVIIARYDDILYSMTDAWNMNDNEMPPEKSNVPHITEEVIAMFIKWKELGFAD